MMSRYRCNKCDQELQEIGIPPTIQALQGRQNILNIGEQVSEEIKNDPFLFKGLYCPSCNKALCPPCANMQSQICPICNNSGLIPAYRPLLNRITRGFISNSNVPLSNKIDCPHCEFANPPSLKTCISCGKPLFKHKEKLEVVDKPSDAAKEPSRCKLCGQINEHLTCSICGNTDWSTIFVGYNLLILLSYLGGILLKLIAVFFYWVSIVVGSVLLAGELFCIARGILAALNQGKREVRLNAVMGRLHPAVVEEKKAVQEVSPVTDERI